MKKSILCFVLSILALAAQAKKYHAQGDSLIVQFGNNTRMVIHAKDKAGIAQLKNYDLNKIVRDLGMTLDSNNNESYIFINEKTGKKYLHDTILVISRKDGNIKISINEPKVNAQIDTTAVANTDDNTQDSGNDNVQVVRHRRFSNPRSGFNINLGLSAYSQNNATTYNSQDYDLRTIGSRFLSVGIIKSLALSRGKKASLGLDFGLNVAWYNLMFEGNNSVRKDANAVSFPNVFDNSGKSIELSKSKLATSYLNASLMPTVAFHRGVISYLSAGVYAGYRLGGYTKTKTADAGRTERLYSNYFLENVRAGVAVELGIRRFPDLFVNYDLNSLYEKGKGPDVRVVSFGIRL